MKSDSQFEHRDIVCAQCRGLFRFSSQDQKWFLKQGWPAPTRCDDCRSASGRVKDTICPDESKVVSVERTCVVCRESFTVNVGEQLALLRIIGPAAVLPRRCKGCRNLRKTERTQEPRAQHGV